MASILSIGTNKKALAERHRILREAGFDVVSSRPDELPTPLASTALFQVAIFGPLVPESERNQIAARLVQAYRHIRIIMLYEETIRQAELADAVLNAKISSDDLARMVHYLIDSQQIASRDKGRSA